MWKVLSLTILCVFFGASLAFAASWSASYNSSTKQWDYPNISNSTYWGTENTNRYHDSNNKIISKVWAGNEKSSEIGVEYKTTIDLNKLGKPSISGGYNYVWPDDVNFTDQGSYSTVEVDWSTLKAKYATNSVGYVNLGYSYKGTYNWNDISSDHALFAGYISGYYQLPIEYLKPITIGY
jgi:hypothetical protein